MTNEFDTPTAAIVISIFALIFLYVIYSIWRDVIHFFLIHYLGLSGFYISNQRKFLLETELEKILYFRNLSARGKRYFFNRTAVFLLNKNFFGDGINLSDEIKVYISACAVQLTFRIRGFYIEHIKLIRVFPKSVWSQMAQHKVKGLTTGGGVMWLSWEDIKEGFAIQDDGINLGIHEMAHAYKLSLVCTGSSFNRFCRALKKWERVSESAFQKLKNGDENFFRKYGAANKEEFWAVNVEAFFEKPEEMLQHYHEIFFSLCKVFNQNPMNIDADYAR